MVVVLGVNWGGVARQQERLVVGLGGEEPVAEQLEAEHDAQMAALNMRLGTSDRRLAVVDKLLLDRAGDVLPTRVIGDVDEFEDLFRIAVNEAGKSPVTDAELDDLQKLLVGDSDEVHRKLKSRKARTADEVTELGRGGTRWRPIKTVQNCSCIEPACECGQFKEVVDVDDHEIQRVRERFGANAAELFEGELLKLDEVNGAGRYPTRVLWRHGAASDIRRGAPMPTERAARVALELLTALRGTLALVKNGGALDLSEAHAWAERLEEVALGDLCNCADECACTCGKSVSAVFAQLQLREQRSGQSKI